MGLNAWLPAFGSESLITNIINVTYIIECKWSVHTWWYFLTLALMKFDLKQFRLRLHSDKEQMA